MKPDEIREMKKRLAPGDELINDTIEKIEKTKSRRDSTAPRWQAAAAVALCSIIIAVGVFAVPYFTGNGIGDDTGVPGENETSESDKIDVTDEDVVLPPVRESKNPAKASYVTNELDLAAFANDSVAIVHLRVKNWLGDSENYKMTCFEAEIIEVYGGEIPDEIVLVQDGTSELTYEYYPLFTYGNELFLFLEKIETRIEWYKSLLPNVDYADFDYENAYSIATGPLGVFQIGTSDKGESYIVPQFFFIAENTMKNFDNYGAASESGLTAEAASAAKHLNSVDRYVNNDLSPDYIYKLDDMVKFVEDAIE